MIPVEKTLALVPTVAPSQINPVQMRLSCLSKTWNHPALQTE